MKWCVCSVVLCLLYYTDTRANIKYLNINITELYSSCMVYKKASLICCNMQHFNKRLQECWFIITTTRYHSNLKVTKCWAWSNDRSGLSCPISTRYFFQKSTTFFLQKSMFLQDFCANFEQFSEKSQKFNLRRYKV